MPSQHAASKQKVVIAQTAPAVRVSLGEELGMEPGQAVTGKMVTALKQVGVGGRAACLWQDACDAADRPASGA